MIKKRASNSKPKETASNIKAINLVKVVVANNPKAGAVNRVAISSAKVVVSKVNSQGKAVANKTGVTNPVRAVAISPTVTRKTKVANPAAINSPVRVAVSRVMRSPGKAVANHAKVAVATNPTAISSSVRAAVVSKAMHSNPDKVVVNPIRAASLGKRVAINKAEATTNYIQRRAISPAFVIFAAQSNVCP